MHKLTEIIDTVTHPISDTQFIAQCKHTLETYGALVLSDFLLGWHFDNSSFAITLLIQRPRAGGVFEYIEEMCDADKGEMNYAGVEQLLNLHVVPKTLQIESGDLVLFRGRNAIHRVTPTQGDITRMLVVLWRIMLNLTLHCRRRPE